MEMNQTHICSEKRDLYKTNRNDSHCLTHTHFLEKNSIGKTVVINGGLINVKVLQLFFKIYPYNGVIKFRIRIKIKIYKTKL